MERSFGGSLSRSGPRPFLNCPRPSWFPINRYLPPSLGYSWVPICTWGQWGGEYLVEELPYFVDVDFRVDSPGHSKSVSPHVTKQIRSPKDEGII